MVLWRLVTRGLGIISTLFLARVLVPQDFGIVAIATTYVAAFDSISAVGLQDAIIRIGGNSDHLHDTAFTLGILRSTINGILVALSAPLAAAFFNEPRIVPVLHVLAVLTVLEGFENIGVVDFRRAMRFDKDFQLFLLPRLVGVVVTITCAMVFKTYWGLVAGITALRLVRLAATYVLHPYRPKFSMHGWQQISSFSFWTWASSIATLARDRCWTMVIGRFFDPAAVGIFTMASEIGLLPISEFIYPICRALFAGFTMARHQGTNLGPAFARTIGVMALIALPSAIGISAVGNYIVDVALGPKWGNAVGIMQIISASAPFYLLTAIGSTVMNAAGNIRNNFWIIAASAVVGVIGSAVMAHEFGMLGVAGATAILMTFEGVLFLVVAMRSVEVSVGEIVYRLWRPLVATLVMTIVLWASGYGWQASTPGTIANFRECGAAIALGVLSYGGSIFLLWKLSRDKDPLELFLLGTARRAILRR
ncbi:lipopolysaccharide biosynthesis protein [Aliidongia dinghuensis]|uniref:Lipopolysaccharide biosynthesis protein n=1 Tax=Aliidongia dinghuensis TaxID=1867774 RepID=A0A8J2YS08_9PROT|nr:oligosaccharide flippase family protein [Aliidongia dinghuensis]GGF10752.1 lipopolysaccharide biosynthesis protein [Aliidongia dinghuensis]